MMNVRPTARMVRCALVSAALLTTAACGGGGGDGGGGSSAPEPTYTVTPSATAVAVTPSAAQTVVSGGTQAFTVTPAPNHTVSQAVGGTCAAGAWSGNTYTTGPVTADCTVQFTGTPITWLVTPTADAGVVPTPSSAQTVVAGEGATFSLAPNVGYDLSRAVGGDCPAGTWTGDVYTTGAVVADCSVVFASVRIFSVTPIATGVTVAPETAQLVASGGTQAFTVTPAPYHLVSRIVGGTCAAGAWSGDTYTTGPVTADCTVGFTLGCETCGGTCVAAIPAPALLTDTGAGEVCTTPCAVQAAVTPACGACGAACGLGESCVNGACRCLQGAPTCRPTRDPPTCAGRPGGCPFFRNSDLHQVTARYAVVEVDGAADTDLWIHVDPRSLFPGGAYYPYVMECQADQGTLYYPRNQEQSLYFDVEGHITSLAGLERTTTTTRFCRPFAEGPIFSLLSSADFPRGYFIKFRPDPGESGYGYQVMSILMFDAAEANTTMRVVDYVINVLPDPAELHTVTSTAHAWLAVTPSGPQGLAHGATPSFDVTGGGDVAVRGTCPRGTWSGSTYTITEPLRAGCTVDFYPAIAVTESHSANVAVTPSGVRSLAWGGTQTYLATSGSPFTVGGTCAAGSWSGARYTVGPLTDSCSVEFNSPSACLGADACVAAFDATSAPTVLASPYFGSPGGAAFGPDVCPAGYALVGLQGGQDGNVAWIAAECGFVARTATAGVTTVRVDVSAPTRLATHGSGSPPPFTLRCPPDAVVTRVDGYADAAAPGGPVTAGLHELSVYCSPVTWSGTAVTVGAPALVGTAPSSWSMSASQPFSFGCPAEMAMGAFEGRAGIWVDGVGFRCYPFAP